MSDEWADAIPEAARQAAVSTLWEFAQDQWGWGTAELQDVTNAAEVVLAAAAPHMAGSEEAERLKPCPACGLVHDEEDDR